MNQLLDSQEETNYNLSSIESGIQMLVEANEQKEKENLQLKKTRFVRNFIRNDFKSREEVLQAAQEKASIEIENTMYLAVLLGERSDSNESRAHAMMLDVIAQAAHLDGYGIHLVSNNQSLFVLFPIRRNGSKRRWYAVYHRQGMPWGICNVRKQLSPGISWKVQAAYLEAGYRI